jgi:tetratricopeptide (TPR) repeat protein
VLIRFQRTYEDAQRVSEETGKPILVCVNMDGEIASEHYAGVRYRQPEIARLYEPYVCVIASTYRHNPRDYDEEGRRILCPRFGSVTCGEHIRIEPQLFGLFLDDTRVAPRHIMVEDGSEETFDVYYAWDTESVFTTIREGIENRPPAEPTVNRGDQPLVERVDSRDVEDRDAIERAYLEGDQELRRTLLVRAGGDPSLTQVDLLRLAIYGADPELGQLAWRTLAGTESVEAVPLLRDVLDLELEAEERDALIGALERLGDRSPRARRLARVHRGLSLSPEGLDLEGWRAALGDPDGGPDPVPPLASLAAVYEEASVRASIEPSSSDSHAAVCLAAYELAVHPQQDRRLRDDLLAEARREALAARDLGGDGWEVRSVLAVTARALGRPRDGYEDAVAALGFGAPADARGWRAKETLSLFVEARQRAIHRAMLREEAWPPVWLAEADAGFALLARHPHGTAREVVEHYDYLRALDARGLATRALESSFARFMESPLVHDRLRARLLDDHDLTSLRGLEATYDRLLASAEGQPEAVRSDLEWYAGYASLVAAEFHRRADERVPALAAYDRGVAHFERAAALDPETAGSASHYIALALAGRARMALEAGELERAVEELLAALARDPEAADDLDGLGFTPVMTATTLRSRLVEAGMAESEARVAEALAGLRPELLEPPAFDRPAPGTEAAGTRDLRRGRRRR